VPAIAVSRFGGVYRHALSTLNPCAPSFTFYLI
jgi:hypothetical protein